MSLTNAPKISRRGFLRGAAVAGAAILPSRLVFGKNRPSNTINLALIGAGGRMEEDLREITKNKLANIVAMCDVDDKRAARTYEQYPKAPKYKDFRALLDKEKHIDAVMIAIPDHMHVHAALAAIQLGKHVYCEKPLTHTVLEARILAKAAREKKVATQMGNQGMAFEGNRVLCEWLDAGVIGAVREVHAWSDRPSHNGKLFWAQGVDRPTDTPPIPDSLDWPLWLGPAPDRPYHPAYVPFKWRGWWDFGSGGLGDMGIHNLAPIFSALRLGAPDRVSASSPLFNNETLPLATSVHYHFPARTVDLNAPCPSWPLGRGGAAQSADLPAVDLHWYDGGILPRRPDELEPGEELDPEDGVIFVGEKGKILCEGWGTDRVRLLPKSLMDGFTAPPALYPRSIGHHAEWIAACKGEGHTRSNFDFAGPLTEAVLLGVAALRAKHSLEWDSDNFKITNHPDLAPFLTKQYRKGWDPGSVG